MAISAVAVTTTDTLETFRVEFNNLVADVASIEQVGASNIIISDGGNIGSASDQDAIAIASTGVVTFSQTPSFTAGITVSNLDIDGATDISAAIVDADLFIVDDGASGTNRKTAASRIKTYIADVTLTTAAQTNITSVGTLTALDVDNININGNTITASTGAVNITPASGSAIVLDGTVNIDAGVVTGVTSLTSNNILIADDGTIGSASDTDAIAIAANGVVTFSAGIAGTLTTAAQTNITSLGTLTALTVDDVVVNGKVITMTGSTDDTFSITAGTNGATTIATVDTAGANGNLTVNIDGYIELNAGDANGSFFIKNSGTSYGTIFNSGNDFYIKSFISDGDLKIQGVDNNSAITALTFDMSEAGAATFNGNIKGGGYVWITTDAQKQFFGANAEIFIQHVHDVGLTLTNSSTGDNKPFVLQLKSEEDAIVADEVIASIELAAGDNSGTDAATVAAGIHAIAEGDFTSSANATKLVFTTGVSETAASSATAKMTLSSAGLLTIADDFMIKDGGTIGVASTNDAITISSAGIVTFKDDIIIKDGGTIGSASDTDAISISSGGVVNISATTATTSTSSGALVVGGGVGIGADIRVGDDILLSSDASQLYFGVHSEIRLTHVHDVGLTVTNTIADTDNTPIVLQLKSEEDAIVADDVIASIELAAGDSDGTDGATVAAGIHAIAEDTFSASANATKLVFTTGVSETAAASATAKMTLSSAGLLTIADDFVIKDGGTIGSASDPDAIAIAADGVVTMNQIPVFSAGINVSGGSIAGTLSTAAQTNITSLGTLTALTVYNSSTPRIEVGYNGTQNHYLGWDGAKLHFQADPQNNNAASAILFSVDGSEAMRLAAGGIATFADDIKIKNGGTIGSASDADSITIASDGQVTLSQNLTITGEVTTTGFSSTDFAAAFIVIEDGGTDGSGTDAGDNLIDETDSDDLLMENVTSWVTSGFTIRDSFGNHLQTVNGVS